MANNAKTNYIEQKNTRQRIVPRSLLRAFGLLKKKNINPLRYQKAKRSEWGK